MSPHLQESRIIEVGCGTGWLVQRMAAYGDVTGTDLADEVIRRGMVIRKRKALQPQNQEVPCVPLGRFCTGAAKAVR